MTELSPGQQRMAAALKKKMRIAEEKKAEILRERGWTCIPPAAEQDTVNWTRQD